MEHLEAAYKEWQYAIGALYTARAGAEPLLNEAASPPEAHNRKNAEAEAVLQRRVAATVAKVNMAYDEERRRHGDYIYALQQQSADQLRAVQEQDKARAQKQFWLTLLVAFISAFGGCGQMIAAFRDKPPLPPAQVHIVNVPASAAPPIVSVVVPVPSVNVQLPGARR